MNIQDKFIRYNLIKYIKNYTANLEKSHRRTSLITFNFFFELVNFIQVNYSDATPLFLEFEEGFALIERDYANFLEELVDTNITSRGKILNDEEVELLQSISERRCKKISKSKLRNKNIDQDIILKFLRDFNSLADRFLAKCTEEIPDKFLEIFTLFQLNSIEAELLKVIYIAERCNLINEHVFHCDEKFHFQRQHFFESSYNSKSINVQHARIEFVTNISCDIVRSNFKESSKLFLTGLVENENDPNLSEFLIDYLEGISSDHLFNNIFEVVDVENAFPLTTNQVPEKELNLIQKMLISNLGISILFKGKPGTGKTELVKSIAKKVGLPLFNLRHSRKKSDKSIPPRKMALYLIQQLYGNKEAIFLVDECEDLINSLPSFRFFRGKNEDDNLKSFINEYLDDNKCKFFFIANNTEEVDESTMRRFNYILTFNDVSNEHRQTLLKSLFQTKDAFLFSDDEIKSLAFSSKLNIGHFGLALTTVQKLDVEQSQKKEFFLDIINNHSKEFLGTGLNLKPINKSYNLDGLNTDHDLKKVCNQLCKNHKSILESDSDTSINVLLSGPPGTGKTEFAKYLATELKRGFIFKQASDLKSMYVGGSEKNIKNAFLEAQNTNSILFIDEIDAFLHSRDNAHRSWEISEVNEFLVCLENFRGIFICATNSTERMDPASLRRFLFKIKFDYLNSSGVMHFFDLFFKPIIINELKSSLKEKLTQMKCLTPSDFNSVKRKILLEPDDISQEYIVELLANEVSYKKFTHKGKIGLSG